MTLRFTQCARATMAAVLLATTAAQSGSQPARSQPNCDISPNGDRDPNCYAGAGDYICPDTSDTARIAATGQQPGCHGEGPCTDPCPPKGTQDGRVSNDSTSDGQSDTTHTDDDDHGHGGGHNLLAWLIAGGALVGGAIAVDHLTGKKWASSEELDANGPRFPIEQKLGRFQVQGYAAGGWPFAVDISTEPGTATWLGVRYKGQEEQSIDLTWPSGGRRVQVIQLPGAFGAIGIARYTLHSALIRTGQKPLFRPLKLYGVGAGPNAVGALDPRQSSLGIDGAGAYFAGQPLFRRSAFALFRPASAPAKFKTGLGAFALGAAAADPHVPRVGSYLSVTTFGPQYPNRPADVSWSVAARQPFQRSELQVLQLPRDGEGKLIAVARTDLDLFARAQASGNWGGMRTNIGAGTYLLQARAWRPRAGGGDWTGAFAPDYVYIR